MRTDLVNAYFLSPIRLIVNHYINKYQQFHVSCSKELDQISWRLSHHLFHIMAPKKCLHILDTWMTFIFNSEQHSKHTDSTVSCPTNLLVPNNSNSPNIPQMNWLTFLPFNVSFIYDLYNVERPTFLTSYSIRNWSSSFLFFSLPSCRYAQPDNV